MAKIESLIESASHDMFNPEHNFNIAKEYEAIGQTAAAMSFYLRAAEYGFESHPNIVYSSLIRISYCVLEQSGREHTLENALLQAIQYMPTRPEAYFVLSRQYERTQKWQECYTWAELGLLHSKNMEPLPVDVEYPGEIGLLFEKSIAAYWRGRKDESVEISKYLLTQDIPQNYRSGIEYNLSVMGMNNKKDEVYGIDPLEPVVTNYRKFFGDTAPIIVDVGTRDGDDANYLYKNLKSSKAIAIDANPEMFELTKSKYPWMEIYNVAISDSEGQTEFYQVIDGDKELKGCSSIATKKGTPDEHAFDGKIQKIIVPMTTLNELLSRTPGIIDVMKIDVELFTWQALQGLGDRLKDVKLYHLETERVSKHEGHVLCDQITQFMKDNGFELVDKSYEWGWGIEDQVWINKDLAVKNKELF